MTRIQKSTIVTLLTALFLACLVPALRAGDSPQPPKDKQPDKLAEIQKQLDKMDESLKKACEGVADKFKETKDIMDLMTKDISAFGKGIDKVKEELKSQQKKIKEIEEVLGILYEE